MMEYGRTLIQIHVHFLNPMSLKLKATLPTRKTNPIHNDVPENADIFVTRPTIQRSKYNGYTNQ